MHHLFIIVTTAFVNNTVLVTEWRIKFKIACITILPSLPTSINPWNITLHLVPCVRLTPRVRTCFGSRSFAVAAPTIWNSLPLAIRSSVSTYSFRRQLKSFFYNSAFRPPHPAPQIRRVSRWHCALYKFTYLLTYFWHQTKYTQRFDLLFELLWLLKIEYDLIFRRVTKFR